MVSAHARDGPASGPAVGPGHGPSTRYELRRGGPLPPWPSLHAWLRKRSRHMAVVRGGGVRDRGGCACDPAGDVGARERDRGALQCRYHAGLVHGSSPLPLARWWRLLEYYRDNHACAARWAALRVPRHYSHGRDGRLVPGGALYERRG